MRTKVLAVLVPLVGLVLLVSANAFTIPNLNSPRTDIYTSGQPDAEGFRHLSRMGVKTVINVLPERNCIPDEPAMVTSNNMKYRSLPFQPSDFREETIEQFSEIVRTSEKPVLIHCSTGNHVGGLWFAYRVMYERASLAEALLEARAIGLRPQLEEPLFDWVMSQRNK